MLLQRHIYASIVTKMRPAEPILGPVSAVIRTRRQQRRAIVVRIESWIIGPTSWVSPPLQARIRLSITSSLR
jgi:hypothetical protein